MNDKSSPTVRQKTFEDLKKVNPFQAEYWSARDLQPLLGYKQWRRFEDAIKRALISCEQSGNKLDYHFAGAGKPIVGGKGAVQEVIDYHLSRFACYSHESMESCCFTVSGFSLVYPFDLR